MTLDHNRLFCLQYQRLFLSISQEIIKSDRKDDHPVNKKQHFYAKPNSCGQKRVRLPISRFQTFPEIHFYPRRLRNSQ